MSKSENSPKKFYFLNNNGGSTSAPNGQQALEIGDIPADENKESSSSFSWLTSFFGQPKSGYQALSTSSSTPNAIGAKPRSVPVKIEPKVFFANERTFLAWLHMATTLASISIAIVA